MFEQEINEQIAKLETAGGRRKKTDPREVNRKIWLQYMDKAGSRTAEQGKPRMKRMKGIGFKKLAPPVASVSQDVEKTSAKSIELSQKELPKIYYD